MSAFLFERDLFGLAENGRYVNSTQTITSATVYRLPLRELATLLKRDGDLQFHFLIKVTHELREAHKRTILVNRSDDCGRLAMFIALMASRQEHAADHSETVTLPMTRSEIAAILGLSLQRVSRAAAELEQRRLIAFESRRARILDPAGLAKLLSAG